MSYFPFHFFSENISKVVFEPSKTNPSKKLCFCKFETTACSPIHPAVPKCVVDRSVTDCVSGTLQAGGGHEAAPTFRRDFTAWPLQCHMLPRCILAIVLHRGDLQEEKWGLVDTDRLPCRPLDLCVCNRAIYEGTVAPFPSDGGGWGGGCHLFATEAAVQILALPWCTCLQPQHSCRPDLRSHPVSRYTSFVKRTKEDKNTMEEHFSIALALHWCSDSG